MGSRFDFAGCFGIPGLRIGVGVVADSHLRATWKLFGAEDLGHPHFDNFTASLHASPYLYNCLGHRD